MQDDSERPHCDSRSHATIPSRIAEAERDAQILRGQGDAERIRIFGEAVSADPEFYAFLRSMEAYGRAFSSDDTTMVLTPDSEFFEYFDVSPGLGD